MSTFQVAEILRYPVKSMQGERLEDAVVTANGIPFDRGWAIKDEQTGNIRGAKRLGNLMKCSARYLEGTNAGLVPHVEITLPEGRTINSDDSRVNKALSEVLGASVSLWPLQPAENEEHYRIKRPADADIHAELRETLALLPEEPLPDFSDFPPELMKELTTYASPRGTYFDAYPMSLLTRAALRHLEDLTPDTTIGVERFRPNIVLEGDPALREIVEFGWIGKDVSLGSARLSIERWATRCVMVTREQPGYERATQIMRTLVRETSHRFAVYASIKQSGAVRLGNELRMV